GRSVRVVGRPVLRAEPVPVAEARARFGLPADGSVLLVFGGSQGAAALNEIALAGFGAEGPAVLHLCGERYFPALEGRVTRPDYKLMPWTDDLHAALDACKLATARARGSA